MNKKLYVPDRMVPKPPKNVFKIEENKKKPKKEGGFTARLQKAMEEAEKQQRANQKRKR